MKIRELLKSITVPQAWAATIAIITAISGIFTFGYKLGYRDYQIQVCYDIIKLKDKEIMGLMNDKQTLKNEIAKYKTIIFALKREKKEITPILKYLLEEYEKEIKDNGD